MVLLPSAMFGVKLYDVYGFNSVLHSAMYALDTKLQDEVTNQSK